MRNRCKVGALPVTLAAALLAGWGVAAAQTKSSVQVFGPGISGPLKTERCNAGAVCTIPVRAALGPVDLEAEVAGQRECVIRVPVAKAVRPATTTLRWELSAKSLERGFSFRLPGVTIDPALDGSGNPIDVFGGVTLVSDNPSHSGVMNAVTATKLANAFATASSYTIFLRFVKPNPPPPAPPPLPPVLAFDCDGHDPIIVSRD